MVQILIGLLDVDVMGQQGAGVIMKTKLSFFSGAFSMVTVCRAS